MLPVVAWRIAIGGFCESLGKSMKALENPKGRTCTMACHERGTPLRPACCGHQPVFHLAATGDTWPLTSWSRLVVAISLQEALAPPDGSGTALTALTAQ